MHFLKITVLSLSKAFVLLFFMCSCQKEVESDQVIISATGKCAFSLTFDGEDGYRHTVGFDCTYSRYLPVQIPQGQYLVSVYTNDFSDSLDSFEFIKGPHWQELQIDW